MARLTLQDMVDQVLSQADMEATSSTRDGFVTTDEVIAKINLELSELYDLIVTTWEDYAVRLPYPTITTAEGEDTYQLPTGFYKLRRLYEVSGSDLKPIEPLLPHRAHFGEAPSAGRVIQVRMIPEFTPLDDLAEEINWRMDYHLPWGWEDFAIWGAVARLLGKEESDPSQAIANQAKARARILSAAPSRDSGEPDRVIDVAEDLEALEEYQDAYSTLKYLIQGPYLILREGA